MSHKRIPKRKAAIAVGSVAALGAAALLLPNANASQTDAADSAAPKTLKATAASDLASRLQVLLGDAFAGSYYEADKQQLVINVAKGGNSSVITEARKAGAAVREVDNSLADLKAGAQTLKAEATIPGTAWALDPRTNKIRVTADSTVTGAKWDTIESTVKSLGSGMATIKKTEGTFKTLLEGGDAIFGGSARCSLGFNVKTGDGTPGFLTAGHCAEVAAEWSDTENGAPIATVQEFTFSGTGDFALMKYNDPATVAPSIVDAGNGETLNILRAIEAEVGQGVFRMGATTGRAQGEVTGVDATANLREGSITGLIQTNVCAERGDSGGSLFTGDGDAVGLTSVGSGDCTVGGETFFQPVTTALAAVGATIG